MMEIIEIDERGIYVQILITVFFSLAFLFGTIGNFWVFYAVKYHRAIQLDTISVNNFRHLDQISKLVFNIIIYFPVFHTSTGITDKFSGPHYTDSKPGRLWAQFLHYLPLCNRQH